MADRAGVAVAALSGSDAAALANGARSPDWHPGFPGSEDVGLARLALTRAEWSEPDLLFAVRLAGVVVGTVALTPRDAGWDLGYHVVEPLRGRGLATAAVGLLAARYRPLRAEVEAANGASGEVLRRNGFEVVESGPVQRWELVSDQPARRGAAGRW